MKLFTIQLRLMLKRKSFLISLLLMILFVVFAFSWECFKYYGHDIVAVPAAKYLFCLQGNKNSASFIFTIVFPIVATLPFSDSFFEERKNKTLELCLMRMSNNKYYYSKLFAVFFSGFIIMFLPLIINMFLNLLAFPSESTVGAGNISIMESHLFIAEENKNISTVIFKNLYINNTILYDVLIGFILSLACAFMAVITYQISFFYKKSQLILTVLMFVIYNFYDLMLGIFSLEEFQLKNYIKIHSVNDGQSYFGLAVIFTFLFIASALPILFAKRKLGNPYD